MKAIDAIIRFVCVAAAAFAGGLWVGEDYAAKQHATRCIAQEGEKLASTVQTQDGLVCVWAQFPMRSKVSRRAT